MADETNQATTRKDSEDFDYDVEMRNVLKSFTNRFCSLTDIYPLMLGSYEQAHSNSNDEFDKFISDHKDADDEFQLPPEKFVEFHALKKRFHGTGTLFTEFNMNSVVILMGLHERLLASTARLTLRHRPELARTEEKKLNYTTIISAQSIEELRSICIDNTVDALMHDSHESQVREVVELCGLDFQTPNNEEWKNFLELSQRRHLFVHTGGVVSRKYLRECKLIQRLEKDINHGDRVSVDHEYLAKACNAIPFVALSAFFAIWRKHSNDKSFYEIEFLNTCVELINSQLHLAAIALNDTFTNKGYKWLNAEHQHYATLNAAQAHKWAGNEKEYKKLLNNFDTSVLNDKYKLVKNVLEDNFADAAKMIESSKTQTPSAEELLGWPVFREFRKSDEFKRVFEKKFGFKPSYIKIGIEIPNEETDQPEA